MQLPHILAITGAIGKMKTRDNVLDNRFKEAILTLAESFDSETIRLHPDQNIPLLKPRIERLVENGDRVF